MAELPPDLDHLGTVLTSAATRARAQRAHRAELRRRLLGCLGAATLVFAAMPASHLGRADQAGQAIIDLASAAPAEAAEFCDLPHGSARYMDDMACVVRFPQPQAAR